MNYFVTDKDKETFFANTGLSGNQSAMDFYSGGFDAASEAGKKYFDDYQNFGLDGPKEAYKQLHTPRWGRSSYYKIYDNAGNFLRNDSSKTSDLPFLHEYTKSNYDLTDANFLTGLSDAQKKGFDDWFSSTRDNTDLNAFDYNFDGTIDSQDESSNFFDNPNYGGLFNSGIDSSDIIENFVSNNPNKSVFDDATSNIYETVTREATEADVEAGLATAVGEMIEEEVLNIPSKSDAQRAAYFESMKDRLDELKLKQVISDENYQKLLELSNALNDLQVSSSNEYLEAIEGFNESLRNALLANNATTESELLSKAQSLYDAVVADELLLKNSNIRDSDSLESGLLNNNYANRKNRLSDSSDLADALLSGLNTQYQDIADVLRGDSLNAMRAGLSGTNNATNRLLVDANMRAARDRAGLEKDIRDAQALRDYGILEDFRANELGIKDSADTRTYNFQTQYNREINNLKDQFEAKKEQISADRINADKSIQDDFQQSSFEYKTMNQDQLKALRDKVAQRNFGYGQDYQNSLAKMKNDFADFIGSTPDETDFIVQLAQEWVELVAEQGRLGEINAEEHYDAVFGVLKMIAEEPNPSLPISLLQSSISDLLENMGKDEAEYLSIMDSKYENAAQLADAILSLNTSDPEYLKIATELRAIDEIMKMAQSTTSGGVNPQTSDKPVVPTYDSESAAAVLSQLQNLGNQSGNQGIISGIAELIEDFNKLGDIFSGDDETDTDGDGTPDNVDPDPNDPAIA